MCWFIEIKAQLAEPVHAWRPPKAMPVRAHGRYPDYLLSDSGICSCDLVLADGAQLAGDVITSLQDLLAEASLASLELLYYWSDPPRRRPSESLLWQTFEARNRAEALSPGKVYCLASHV